MWKLAKTVLDAMHDSQGEITSQAPRINLQMLLNRAHAHINRLHEDYPDRRRYERLLLILYFPV
jgi:hypothetical protein